MKLLGSTKSKVTKDENGESVPCLETTEVVLVHCNIVKNNFNILISRAFFPIINRLVNYQTNYIYPKNLYS